MNQIRLIALDLDSTTLDGEGRLTERTRRAIENALAAGIEVAAASGRTHLSLPQELLAIKGMRYAVTSNGATVYDFREDRALHNVTLPSPAVEALLEILSPEFEIQVFIKGQAYASARYYAAPERYAPISAHSREYLRRTRKPVEDIRAFTRERLHELDMFNILTPNETVRDALISLVRERVEGVYVTSSAPRIVEVMRKDCGKAAGVAWLAGHLGISPEQVAAFGDAENDRDMIEYAGLGCAVANAVPSVLEAADRIVPANTADGVAQTIEELLRLRSPTV